MRFVIDIFVGLAAAAFRIGIALRIRTYRLQQAWLCRRFRVDDVPVRGFEGQAFALRPEDRRAWTSGSTKLPKHVPYSARRVRRTLLVFVSAMFRNLAMHLPSNRTFFALTATTGDRSLTSMLTVDQGAPSYLGALHAPHRLLLRPDVQRAIDTYGEVAVRVWLMTVTNPGLLYATNPSSIATFLESIDTEWEAIRRISSTNELEALFRRFAVNGAGERLRRIASSAVPLPMQELFPGLRAFSCWDGGYVKPFLDRIRRRLPADRYLHLAMFSMSTETVETIPVGGHFLPIAPGVLYEFIAPGKALLRRPHELRVGVEYTMIVSDRYGLRRYDTEDLFECVGFVRGIPDLRFSRRRNLSYSFTGEKLTGPQLQEALADATERFPQTASGFLTCFPTLQPAPCYCVVFVREGNESVCGTAIAAFVEQRLCEFNPEFAAKIESGRLGRTRFEIVSRSDFVKGESQFKFLPLYPRLWEAGRS
jgi:hypothetical protein